MRNRAMEACCMTATIKNTRFDQGGLLLEYCIKNQAKNCENVCLTNACLCCNKQLNVYAKLIHPTHTMKEECAKNTNDIVVVVAF